VIEKHKEDADALLKIADRMARLLEEAAKAPKNISSISFVKIWTLWLFVLTVILVTGSKVQLSVTKGEPCFREGDLLFITNFQNEPIEAGDHLVYKFDGRDAFSRVLEVSEKKDGTLKFMIGNKCHSNSNDKPINNSTDGRYAFPEVLEVSEKKDGTLEFMSGNKCVPCNCDNNSNNKPIYNSTCQKWIDRSEVVGRVRVQVPYVGFYVSYFFKYLFVPVHLFMICRLFNQ
jgi:hypothetical protein